MELLVEVPLESGQIMTKQVHHDVALAVGLLYEIVNFTDPCQA
jgi:hypothetical protein